MHRLEIGDVKDKNSQLAEQGGRDRQQVLVASGSLASADSKTPINTHSLRLSDFRPFRADLGPLCVLRDSSSTTGAPLAPNRASLVCENHSMGTKYGLVEDESIS